MTIPDAFKPKPLPALDANLQLVVSKTGLPTAYGVQIFEAWRRYNNGGSRVVPCGASGTNVITLTPNDASPILEGYRDYDCFAFVAANTSTGLVTATVVPETGSLSTLKVYKTDGAAQATTGDIVGGSFYLAYFADAMDGGSGGFVLK